MPPSALRRSTASAVHKQRVSSASTSLPRHGFFAQMLAERTKSSSLLPGSHSRMNSRLWSFGRILISTKPASRSISSVSLTVEAPEMQAESRRMSSRHSGGSPPVATTSLTARRPPGLSTRKASP